MKISISSPFPVESLQGNSVSARRIGRLLKAAGHEVEVFQDGFAQGTDVLIALNAWRSADIIAKFSTETDDSIVLNDSFNTIESSNRPKMVVVMTGSDLFPYDGIIKSETLRSIKLADSIVITQGQAREKIDHPLVREIRKSLVLPEGVEVGKDQQSFAKKGFKGIIVAHLRAQKNPFLFLRAIPYLEIPVRIEHYGNANSDEFRDNAEKYRSAAYQWMGEIPRLELLKALQAADFLLNTSYIEGSSNAIYESIALGTPIIASAIPGNVGVLGEDYPGLYRADDGESLAKVLDQFSSSKDFREELSHRCSLIKQDFGAEREQKDWSQLIADICG